MATKLVIFKGDVLPRIPGKFDRKKPGKVCPDISPGFGKERYKICATFRETMLYFSIMIDIGDDRCSDVYEPRWCHFLTNLLK